MTISRSRMARCLALSMALTLVAVSCSDDAGSGDATEGDAAAAEPGGAPSTTISPDDEVGLGGAETDAGTLRADLASLMAESVHLTARSVARFNAQGPDIGAQTALAGVVRENTTDLSDAVGAVFGLPGAREFQALWAGHLRSFEEYARAGSTQNASGQAQATDALDGFRDDMATLFVEQLDESDINEPTLSASLSRHVDTSLAMVDAIVAGDPTRFEATLEAATVMDDVALTFSVPMATQLAFEGDPAAPGAALRAQLAVAFENQVYAIGDAITDGETAPALAAIEAASEQGGELIGDVYGVTATVEFTRIWQERAELYLARADAIQAGNERSRERVSMDLSANRDELGEFFETRTEGALSAEAMAEELVPQQESMIAAVDALANDRDTAIVALRTAAEDMPEIATALAAVLQVDLTA